jgi:hypothetical protein
MAIDAAFLESNDGQAYVFKGDRMVCIKVIPSTIHDKVIWGPKSLATGWKPLAKVGFTKVDAVLPVPNHKGHIWVFSGTQYARIDMTEESVWFGPAPIAKHWPSLVKAGFTTVNAVFPTPGEPNHAYFFHKEQFARITLTPGKDEDTVYDGPAPLAKRWPALEKAKFTTINAVIPTPGFANDGYFFCGEQYVRLTVTPDDNRDTVVFGPASIQKHWTCLKDL